MRQVLLDQLDLQAQQGRTEVTVQQGLLDLPVQRVRQGLLVPQVATVAMEVQDQAVLQVQPVPLVLLDQPDQRDRTVQLVVLLSIMIHLHTLTILLRVLDSLDSTTLALKHQPLFFT